MASLGQIQEATLTANSDIQSAMNTTTNALSSLDVEGASAGAQTASNSTNLIFKNGAYDFVGIAGAAGVDAMKQAIQTYCDNVNAEIEKLVVTASPEGTFAGKYAVSINDFTKAIQSSCMSNVNALRKFSKDLDAVYTAMQAQDTNVGSSITNDAATINSSVSNESF